MLTGVPAVEVMRGERVESLHAVAACVADADGALCFAAGDVDAPVFWRSSAKPLITAAAVRAGVAERFGFGERELAIMSASHNGEPDHTELVAAMLERIGATVADLRCGVHPPQYEPAARALAERGVTPTALHHNCSGKHTGILALARVLGAPLEGYLEPEHPAQAAILELCERVTGERLRGDRLAVDGCGIPAFASPLRTAARTFARFATLERLDDRDAAALGRVRDAMAAEPWYVAGTGRFDSDLIVVTGGRIVGKAGAEAVHCQGWREPGLGAALKVVDGTRRAMPVAAMAVLSAGGALHQGERHALEVHARAAVHNAAGRVVGEVRTREDWTAGFTLRQPTLP